MKAQSSEREQGFTLIELVMAMAISGILLAAIAAGFIASLHGTAAAHDRFVGSNGAHTLSTYFTADVQSANPDMISTASAATVGCLTEPPSNTANVLRLRWSEQTTSSDVTAYSVSYRTRWIDDGDGIQGPTEQYSGTSADQYQLVRYSCSDHEPGTTSTDVATIVADKSLEEHIVVAALDQPIAPTQTAATVIGQDITLKVFAALGKNETTPYSYDFTGTMRTPEPVPHVTSITRNGAATTNAATVSWTVTFSEAVTGVDTASPFADFAFTSTGGLTGASVASVTGSGTTYTVTANSGSGQGTLALTVDDDDTIRSSIDNDPLGGTGADNGNYTGGTYTVDRVAPTAIVAQSSSQADPTSTLPILFTATFSESVTDFDDATDVTNTGTAPGAVFSITGSGKDYVISVSGLTGNGTVIPSIVAGAANDSAGNGNTASTSGGDNQVTYSTVAPSVTITNVELKNTGGGSGLGKLEKDDQVVITFSDSMDVDTFCSTWTGPTPSITANGVVRVTVTNGTAGANDVLTVTTTSGCAFNFGSLDLGSAGWVTGTTHYEGNGGNASEIAYNDATRQLTITLGSGTSGPSNAASTPTYTSHTDIRSSTGGAVANSPFTATIATRF